MTISGVTRSGAIGLVWATASGQAAASRLAAALPDARLYEGSPAESLPRAFAECSGVVAFLATGAAVRILAPHLGSKSSDAGVVCVDEALRYAVALVGGHGGGANELARRVAAVLGAEPVITTATDAVGIPGLDTLGWPVEGDVAAVSRAILDGSPVRLVVDAVWPLPALPANVTPDSPVPAATLIITDRSTTLGRDHGLSGSSPQVVLRPPSLVVGVGAARGVSAAEVGELIDAALADVGLSPLSVRCLATAEVKADEAGILEAARERGWPVVAYPAGLLARIPVPNPSDVVAAEVGTPSVAEAAALAGAVAPAEAAALAGAADRAYPLESPAPQGDKPLQTGQLIKTFEGLTGDRKITGPGAAQLVVEKRKSPMATVAVARHRPRGRLALVGLGPGAPDLLTPRAVEQLRAASVVIGLDQYVDQVRHLLRPGTRVLATGLGSEEERARSAVEAAQQGHAVALIGSGDAGVYAMASPALEAAADDIDVAGVPGITAALAAAAVLGAPLGHDHAYISLSDLHTPWDAIERRVRAAAGGDFVVCFYNPRSRGRDWQLPKALSILAAHRPPDTPVGTVRNATRPDESAALTTLADLDPDTVDMYTVVVVGSSNTKEIAGRMVTPRGYRWR